MSSSISGTITRARRPLWALQEQQRSATDGHASAETITQLKAIRWQLDQHLPTPLVGSPDVEREPSNQAAAVKQRFYELMDGNELLYGAIVAGTALFGSLYMSEIAKDGQYINRYIAPNVEDLTGSANGVLFTCSPEAPEAPGAVIPFVGPIVPCTDTDVPAANWRKASEGEWTVEAIRATSCST